MTAYDDGAALAAEHHGRLYHHPLAASTIAGRARFGGRSRRISGTVLADLPAPAAGWAVVA